MPGPVDDRGVATVGHKWPRPQQHKQAPAAQRPCQACSSIEDRHAAPQLPIEPPNLGRGKVKLGTQAAVVKHT